MQALLSAVLPQDLNVMGITEWDAAKASARRREGRLVGNFILLGLAVGAALSYIVDHGVSIGIIAGGFAGLLLGWCLVGWQRHRAVA
jgi:hypothetical protein